jgi:hypothetical protein
VLFIAGFKDGFTHSWAARNFLLREGAFILPELAQAINRDRRPNW